MLKVSRALNVSDFGGYNTLLFQPKTIYRISSLQEVFPYEYHVDFYYDTFGELIYDSRNEVFPWIQY